LQHSEHSYCKAPELVATYERPKLLFRGFPLVIKRVWITCYAYEIDLPVQRNFVTKTYHKMPSYFTL